MSGSSSSLSCPARYEKYVTGSSLKYLGRALDEDDPGRGLADAVHEVDPLADPERRHLADVAQVEDEGRRPHRLGQALALEGLVDRAGQLEAHQVAVGEAIDRQLGRRRGAGVGVSGGGFHGASGVSS
jgi:hypothetical protein